MNFPCKLKYPLLLIPITLALVNLCSTAIAQIPVPAADPNTGAAINVTSVEWVAMNTAESASALDTNPNPGEGLRIFPDKQIPAETITRNEVLVRAQISEQKAGVKVFFKSLDVDDPSADWSAADAPLPSRTRDIDPTDTETEKLGGDNESGSGNEVPGTGKFPTGTRFGNAVTDLGGKATIIFTVTMQPGDNFRVLATTTEAEFAAVTNHNIPAGNDPSPPEIGGKIPPVKLTEMLTVWRRIHLEIDSMRAPQGNENKVLGHITGVEAGAANAYYQATVDKDLSEDPQVKMIIGALNEDDLSTRLDTSPAGNGRFDDGRVTIGSGAGARVTALLGNGTEFVRTPNGKKFILPFTLSMQGRQTVNGHVLTFVRSAPGSRFHINQTVVAGDYDEIPAANGQPAVTAVLNVVGHNFEVSSNTADEIIVKDGQASLDFVLQDDDSAIKTAVGTYNPDESTGFTYEEQEVLPHLPLIGDTVVNKFKPAYILPVADGGGDVSNNKETVPFFRNVSLPSAFLSQTGAREAQNSSPNSYWVANLCAIYQSGVNPTPQNRSDGDGRNEGHYLAFALKGSGAVIAWQDYFDKLGPSFYLGPDMTISEYEQHVWAHELAHLFGLPDRYPDAPNPETTPTGEGGAMENNIGAFIPKDIKSLRIRRSLPTVP